MRSAFMPSITWRKPRPSSPTSVSAGTSTPSRKTSDVAWLTIASVARIVIAGPVAQVDEERRQAVGAVRGVVRRGPREQQHQVGVQRARGPRLVAVDDPAVVRALAPSSRSAGSRSRRRARSRRRPAAAARPPRAPAASARFCSSSPWRSSVPIVYIWAWHALALPPAALTSSRMTAACSRPRPLPPYSVGISTASRPVGGHRAHERVGVAVGLEPAPVRGRVLRADSRRRSRAGAPRRRRGWGRRPCAASSRFARAQSAR